MATSPTEFHGYTIAPLERDRHVRRSGDDYATQFLTLLPQGQAWPKEPGSTLERACNGLAQFWGQVDSRAADLLEREADPRTTIEILPEWERAFGLPDPCLKEPLTIGDRQRVLTQRVTMLGGQSIAFYQSLAEDLGYTIYVTEYAPFMVGVSQVGDTRMLYNDRYWRWEIGPPEIRFYWTIHVEDIRLTWFRVGNGGGQCGVDPHLRIGRATDLECIIGRWKPAHTDIIFDYSGSALPSSWDFSTANNSTEWLLDL